MKRVYIDTSVIGEVRREKLDDNVTIAYDDNDNIVGVEVEQPIGIDIDDKTVTSFDTTEDQFKPNELWGIA